VQEAPDLFAPGVAACRALEAAYSGDHEGTAAALRDMADALGGGS